MRKIYAICLLLSGMVMASCSDWLDLKPYGEVEADKMFENEEGFIQALNGSYLLLTDPAAYGSELTVGFPDEIVHYWLKRSEFYGFDYKNAEVVSRLDATWLKMYEAIANTNLVLQNLEGKSPDDLEYYNLIRGEALGLRAYLHLDLLRLYGPVLKDGGMEEASIPFHDEFSNRTVRLMKSSEVLGRIGQDLREAYTLLADDPVKVYGRRDESMITPSVQGLGMAFRGCRMNYYAVCATLARYYMLMEQLGEALKYAEEVIEAGQFGLVQRSDVAGADDMKNRMFERELVWALFDAQTGDHLNTLTQREYALDPDYKDYVYTESNAQGTAEDYRYQYWFRHVTTYSPAFHALCKYQRNLKNEDGATKDETAWETVLPLIRLSEMYYIAAEANLTENPAEAYRLLNEVRISRNLSALLPALENDADGLRDQLTYEYRKDFWGEGKLFYYYKRHFMNIRTRDENITATREMYKLPLPQDEIEFGDNNQ